MPSSKSTRRSREHPEGLVRLSRVCQAGPQLQLSSSTPPAGPADPRQCKQSSCLPSITPPLLPQGSGKSQGKIIQRNRLVSSSPALPPRRSWGLPTQHLLYFEDARRRAGYRQGSQFCSLEMPNLSMHEKAALTPAGLGRACGCLWFQPPGPSRIRCPEHTPHSSRAVVGTWNQTRVVTLMTTEVSRPRKDLIIV